MTHAAFDQTFAQRLARVDLTKVMKHVQSDTGMDDATLARAEDLYRKFLTLKGMFLDSSIVPPRLADIVWHAHITDTRQYMADCDILFGRYLHHTMYEEGDSHLDAMIMFTRQRFEEVFHYPIHTGLLPDQAVMACCGGD